MPEVRALAPIFVEDLGKVVMPGRAFECPAPAAADYERRGVAEPIEAGKPERKTPARKGKARE